MTLTVGSLFSGVGGLDLGLERAGMEIRWQCENDDYCSRVLAKHWPEVPNLGDVTKVDWEHVERVDLICGGFPCQPVSNAGRRRAQADPRWLWPEFARAVRDLRPRHVVVENVPGLLVRGMGLVLGDLAALGYDAEWACLSASDFGAPHRRQRVVVVADREGIGRDGSVPTGTPRFFGAVPQGLARWEPEPSVARMVHGLSGVVDGPQRVRALGNAVVPQVAQWIGHRILESERAA